MAAMAEQDSLLGNSDLDTIYDGRTAISKKKYIDLGWLWKNWKVLNVVLNWVILLGTPLVLKLFNVRHGKEIYQAVGLSSIILFAVGFLRNFPAPPPAQSATESEVEAWKRKCIWTGLAFSFGAFQAAMMNITFNYICSWEWVWEGQSKFLEHAVGTAMEVIVERENRLRERMGGKSFEEL